LDWAKAWRRVENWDEGISITGKALGEFNFQFRARKYSVLTQDLYYWTGIPGGFSIHGWILQNGKKRDTNFGGYSETWVAQQIFPGIPIPKKGKKVVGTFGGAPFIALMALEPLAPQV